MTPTFEGGEKKLVVVTSVTPWTEPPRIRHQVTRQLMRFYNVLYVELPFGSAARHDRIEKVGDSLTTLSLARLPRGTGRIWDNVRLFHGWYNSILVRKIEKSIRSLGFDTAHLVNFQFNFPQIMHCPIFATRIYFCNDEFATSSRSSWKKGLLWRYERDVAAAADLCLCVSYPLLAKLSKVSPCVSLFLPGHEFPVLRNNVRIREGRNSSRIRVCFMGFVNRRIRFDWLAELLQDGAIELTLIGPVQDVGSIDRLACAGPLNVREPIEGLELQKALAEQDVLVMPYDTRNEAVRATSAPNKLFQYLACGRPIVISDIPAFVDLPPGFLYRARDAAEFVAKVHEAFRADSDSVTKERIALANENTWDIRGDHLRKFLESGLIAEAAGMTGSVTPE